MFSVCIYCGENKPEALEACETCLKAPDSHSDVIHSIIMSYCEQETYLNFICADELEQFRQSVINGSPIKINPGTFREAEEAYSAVKSMRGPQALKHFSKISHPVMVVTLFVFIAVLLMSA